MNLPQADMPLGRAAIDRCAWRRSEQDLIERLLDTPTTRVVPVRSGRVAVAGHLGRPGSGDRAGESLRFLAPNDCRQLGGPWTYLGADDGGDYLGLALADEPTGDDSGTWFDIRDVGASLSDAQTGLAVTAMSMARWQLTHRHCPACGAATELVEGGWASRCPADGSLHYPRTDPAVIMSVTDEDDRLLLGRGAAWRNARRYSVLAGYVEAGETLENAVRREVAEEAGVEVGEVEYVGNQPWPPSGSLMVGFRARARTTELTIQREELLDARWFTRAQLDEAERSGDVELPPPAAIAHTLIGAWRRGTD